MLGFELAKARKVINRHCTHMTTITTVLLIGITASKCTGNVYILFKTSIELNLSFWMRPFNLSMGGISSIYKDHGQNVPKWKEDYISLICQKWLITYDFQILILLFFLSDILYQTPIAAKRCLHTTIMCKDTCGPSKGEDL